MTRCPLCGLLPDFCCCGSIEPVTNLIPVVLVRHWRELHRKSNTARLAHAALRNSRLLDFGVRDQPLDESPLRGDDVYLLFPPPLDHYGKPVAGGPPVVRLGEDPLPAVGRLVVLDGSWNQARRMSHRIEALVGLPRLALPPPPDIPRRVRKAPGPQFHATLEAVAEAMYYLEGPEVAQPLRRLFRVFVRQALSQGNKLTSEQEAKLLP